MARRLVGTESREYMRDEKGKPFPKPMKRAVPAGSVYYFETKVSFEKVLELFHGQSLSDDRKQEGFGLSYIAGGIK